MLESSPPCRLLSSQTSSHKEVQHDFCPPENLLSIDSPNINSGSARKSASNPQLVMIDTRPKAYFDLPNSFDHIRVQPASPPEINANNQDTELIQATALIEEQGSLTEIFNRYRDMPVELIELFEA